MQIIINIQGDARDIFISGGAPKKDVFEDALPTNITNVALNGVQHQLKDGEVLMFNGNVISGGDVTITKK